MNAIANGFYGDWLAQRGNPLALPMQVLQDGVAVNPESPEIQSPQSTLIVLIHGLMGSETVWDYPEHAGQNYATDLAAVLPATPLCLRYNTGMAIAHNGSELNAVMEALVAAWPVAIERIVLIGHSMGGLVIRSACHQAVQANQAWVDQVRQCVYIGTPHDGSWLAKSAERTARLMRTMPRDYARAVGGVVESRSAGIENLGRDCADNDALHPFLTSAEHFAVSGSLAKNRFNPARQLWGDGLVHPSSAHANGANNIQWKGQASFHGVGHVTLAHHPTVSRQLERWLA
ncbi:MAG: alpha/beta hydrolase [Pseudomonadota bacterium]